jgi:hypothetical protein
MFFSIITRLLKNAPAYRRAGICPALRGIALTLALLDEKGRSLERSAPHITEPDRCKTQPGYYLTGQVVAAP